MSDLEASNERSVLKMHFEEKHSGVAQAFKMRVTDVFNGDATLRQITEAVQIRRCGGRTMNNKNEWNNVRIPRANIELS